MADLFNLQCTLANRFLSCVSALAEDPVRRYNLGEFKEELMSAMGLNTEGEGSAMAFLRRGYKVRRCPPIHRLSREVGLLACW